MAPPCERGRGESTRRRRGIAVEPGCRPHAIRRENPPRTGHGRGSDSAGIDPGRGRVRESDSRISLRTRFGKHHLERPRAQAAAQGRALHAVPARHEPPRLRVVRARGDAHGPLGRDAIVRGTRRVQDDPVGRVGPVRAPRDDARGGGRGGPAADVVAGAAGVQGAPLDVVPPELRLLQENVLAAAGAARAPELPRVKRR
mmetsp:Transcript_19758/g.60884  ORF Transcript_19758/g.60884 Transcript_19758/m.60884 type:complete len:200 (+) Transcript_19758:595-1194(+)